MRISPAAWAERFVYFDDTLYIQNDHAIVLQAISRLNGVQLDYPIRRFSRPLISVDAIRLLLKEAVVFAFGLVWQKDVCKRWSAFWLMIVRSASLLHSFWPNPTKTGIWWRYLYVCHALSHCFDACELQYDSILDASLFEKKCMYSIQWMRKFPNPCVCACSLCPKITWLTDR